MAVSFGLRPTRALLNDANPDLINFYEWVQHGLTIDIPMKNDSETFDRLRKRFNAMARNGQRDSKTAAELFYYLNRTGFNGLFRVSRKGGYNVPFGQHSAIRYERDLRRYSSPMKNWDLMSVDFEQLELDAGDFVYADPPYDEGFTLYTTEGFGWQDQERLAKWLSEHKGPVVLSNRKTHRIEKLYGDYGFELLSLPAPRRISSDGNRESVEEVVATRGVDLGAAQKAAPMLDWG